MSESEHLYKRAFDFWKVSPNRVNQTKLSPRVEPKIQLPQLRKTDSEALLSPSVNDSFSEVSSNSSTSELGEDRSEKLPVPSISIENLSSLRGKSKSNNIVVRT